jgi:hypothetical protein
MNDGGFYKASRTLAADENLSFGEKWVRVIQAHYQAFEGRDPTSAELARALGTTRRGVNKILARLARREQKARPGGNKRPAQAGTKGPETGTKGPPSHSLLDIETKERDMTAPPLLVALQPEKANDKRQCPSLGPQVSGLKPQASSLPILALLHLKAVEGGGKWRLAQWIGQVEEDEAAGRYRRAYLAAFVAGRTAITEAPWKLAEAVRRHAQAEKDAAFRERLRVIRADGLTRAAGPVGLDRRGEPDGPARVVYVDPDRPLLVIERQVPPPPGTSYGPQTKRWDVRTPEDLAAWTFRPDQPVLPFAKGV